MSKLIELNIADIIGSGHCTASEDGQKIYQLIQSALNAGNVVQLSFKSVEDLTTAFLNAAVGQLYSEFSEQQIKAHMMVVDVGQDDLVLLRRVVDRAKDFFKNPDRYNVATSEMLGDPNDK